MLTHTDPWRIHAYKLLYIVLLEHVGGQEGERRIQLCSRLQLGSSRLGCGFFGVHRRFRLKVEPDFVS